MDKFIYNMKRVETLNRYIEDYINIFIKGETDIQKRKKLYEFKIEILNQIISICSHDIEEIKLIMDKRQKPIKRTRFVKKNKSALNVLTESNNALSEHLQKVIEEERKDWKYDKKILLKP